MYFFLQSALLWWEGVIQENAMITTGVNVCGSKPSNRVMLISENVLSVRFPVATSGQFCPFKSSCNTPHQVTSGCSSNIHSVKTHPKIARKASEYMKEGLIDGGASPECVPTGICNAIMRKSCFKEKKAKNKKKVASLKVFFFKGYSEEDKSGGALFFCSSLLYRCLLHRVCNFSLLFFFFFLPVHNELILNVV